MKYGNRTGIVGEVNGDRLTVKDDKTGNVSTRNRSSVTRIGEPAKQPEAPFKAEPLGSPVWDTPNTDLSEQDKQDMFAYAWDFESYPMINSSLRAQEPIPAQYAPLADRLTTLIDRSPLPADATLYRATFDAPDLVRQIQESQRTGQPFTEHGFMSTSLDWEKASEMDNGELQEDSIEFEIHLDAPRGTKALVFDEAIADRPGAYDQQEVLLQRGSQFRVESMEQNDLGIWQARMTLIGQPAPPPIESKEYHPTSSSEPTTPAALSPGQIDLFSGGSAEQHLVTAADGSVHFSPERQALHRQLVEEMLAGHTAQEQPEYHLMGGGPASGKTTLMRALTGDTPDSAVIAADAVKLKLPEYHAGPEGAPFTHEESVYVQNQAIAEAFRRKVHVTLDGTGDSTPESLRSKIDQARAAGYEVHGHYVTVPTEVALERSATRAAATGRYIAPTVTREIHQAVSQTLPQVAPEFDSLEVYDNTGDLVKIMEMSKGSEPHVLEPDQWQAFLAKGADQTTPIASVVPSDQFLATFEDTFRDSPYSAFVTHYSPDEVAGMTPLMASDGKSGVLVHDHGDGRIEGTALFTRPGAPKGQGLAMLRQAVTEHGVNYVECFGPVLPRLYAGLGFEVSDEFPFDPEQAPPGWDYARFDHPSYFTMRLPDGTIVAAGLARYPEGVDDAATVDAVIGQVIEDTPDDQQQFVPGWIGAALAVVGGESDDQ